MKFLLTTLFAIVISSVSAQTNAGIAINAPIAGDALQAGTTFTIKWTVDTSSSASQNINSIALMKGNSYALDLYISNILTSPIPVNPPTYDWAIPAEVETNPSYALAFYGDNGAVTYSTQFIIIGAAPGTSNITAAISSQPAGTASNVAVTKSSTSPNASSPSSTSGANYLRPSVLIVSTALLGYAFF